ncbi:MAG: translation initiation factor IF-2 [Patescibacteria group bacterium]
MATDNSKNKNEVGRPAPEGRGSRSEGARLAPKGAAPNLVGRPPVVVVLGHVDSGKTSLLLAIRKMQFAPLEKSGFLAGFTGAKPGGAITQHIGAYQIEVPLKEEPKSRESETNRGILRSAQDDFAPGGRKITFIDTPGHEAFSAMRSRGAKVADIAVLVVDGQEGVKPQTKEAILHIQKTGVSMIVAINKIDRPEVIPEKIKAQLAKENVIVESLGGKIPSVNVSAKTGEGISELLDTILLLGEVENLKGDLSGSAEGAFIESFLDRNRGPIATLIVSNGVLRVGDIIGTVSVFGKVKILENFLAKPIKEAFPSDPAVIMGLPKVPKIGETFKVFSDPEQAQSQILAEVRKETVSNPEPKDGQRVLNLILKSDVVGSTEAIYEVLKEIPQEKVILNILKSEVGEVNETDIKLAESTRAVIFGFRVKINSVAKQMAERGRVKIITFDIIYDFVEGVRKFMEKIMSSEDVRTELGKLKILAVFLDEKNRQIVGGKVITGEIKRGGLIEVERNEEVVGKGKMINLQKNKKEAEKVSRGEECGILYEGSVKIETGDVLIIYTESKVKGEL